MGRGGPARRTGVVEAPVHHQHRLGDPVEVRAGGVRTPEARVLLGRAVATGQLVPKAGVLRIRADELVVVLRLQRRDRGPRRGRLHQARLGDERLQDHSPAHGAAEQGHPLVVDRDVRRAPQCLDRVDHVGAVPQPHPDLEQRVIVRLGVVAVVHVQGDVPAGGQVPALAGHPLAAHVDRRVDVAVRQHHCREGTPSGGHVEDPCDGVGLLALSSGGAASVRHVVRRVLGRLLPNSAQAQPVTPVLLLGQTEHRNRPDRRLALLRLARLLRLTRLRLARLRLDFRAGTDARRVRSGGRGLVTRLVGAASGEEHGADCQRDLDPPLCTHRELPGSNCVSRATVAAVR